MSQKKAASVCVCVCVYTQGSYSILSENLCTGASGAEGTLRSPAAETPAPLGTRGVLLAGDSWAPHQCEEQQVRVS